MEKSKVYYTSMKVNSGTNLLKKLDHLVREAGIANIDFENKYTAIKIHFGEPGNLAFLRPNYAKVIVDLVKELGGKPFLTDCNTLYVGRRKNALDHLDATYENGFSPFSTGCHVIIADGLKGTDEAEVPVEGGEYVKSAKIGRAIMDADVYIALSHFKGHEQVGTTLLWRSGELQEDVLQSIRKEASLDNRFYIDIRTCAFGTIKHRKGSLPRT